ncbi:MAG: thymidine kinase, partial [Chitinophagales bacterium]|nr:thymidine kinase [Chitinophagales bacterium]
MFSEPIARLHGAGWIEVICGSMFSGKTEELIRRLRRAQIAGKKVEIFKPAIDTRYHDSDIVSHDQNSIRSTPVEHSQSIMLLASGNDVIGIDEAQFLDALVPDVCEYLARTG